MLFYIFPIAFASLGRKGSNKRTKLSKCMCMLLLPTSRAKLVTYFSLTLALERPSKHTVQKASPGKAK
ncbi:unnamed protein product [Camellia sinensis]